MEVKIVERQTNLGLKDLKVLLEESANAPCLALFGCRGGGVGFPVGAVVNEIGIILLSENGGNEAESILLSLLKKEAASDDVKFPAVGYLSQARDRGLLSEEGMATLATFEEDPANGEIVNIVKEVNASREADNETP